MNLVDRVKNILLAPKDEWPKIAPESETTQSMYVGYIMILAAIGPIAILLRSPRGRSEVFAKEFERACIPLGVARGGFYESAEILDLLSLLRLLDNPLQDVPCIAVLRSPLVGLSLDELAEIRQGAKGGHFWTVLNRSAERGMRNAETVAKISRFLERFSRARETDPG